MAVAGYLCAAAPAQKLLRVRVAGAAEKAAVVVGSSVWVRLIGPQASERARAVAQRLESALVAGASAEDVKVRSEGRWVTAIYVKQERVLAVDRELAKAHKSAPQALAERWANRLREMLKGPWAVVVPGDAIDVPLGERRTVKIRGPAAKAVAASVEDEAVAQIAPAGGDIAVRGLSRGDTKLVLETKTARAWLAVRVRPLAAALPARVDVLLTATPTQDQWQRWADYALRCAVRAAPAATLSVEGVPPWPAGRVKVRASGPDLFPIARELAVVAAMKRLALREPDHVLVSNDPERVRVSRVLMRDILAAGEAVRVLWHHLNEAPQPLWFGLRLYNPTAEPATVFLSDAVAGPVADELYAGHVACREYLRALRRGAGVLLRLRPRSRVELCSIRAGPGATVSGLATLQLVDSARLVVEVVAHSDRPPAAAYQISAHEKFSRTTPFRFGGQIVLRGSYTVGKPWLFLPVGKAPRRNRHGRMLHGNYGVLYRVELELRNPTPEPARVELAMRASGGAARGSFLVDGELDETGVLPPGAEAVVTSWLLPAGASRNVTVTTIPQAGSNYPIHLVVRPAGYR